MILLFWKYNNFVSFYLDAPNVVWNKDNRQTEFKSWIGLDKAESIKYSQDI